MNSDQVPTSDFSIRSLESKGLYRTFAVCVIVSIVMILPVLLFPPLSSDLPIGEQLSHIADHRFEHLVYWGSMLILMCVSIGVNLGLSFLGARTLPVLAFTAFMFSVMSTVLVTLPKFIQAWSSLLMAHSYVQNPAPEIVEHMFNQYAQWTYQPMYSLFQGVETCGFFLHLIFLIPIAICLIPLQGRYRLIGVFILVEGVLMAIGLMTILVAPDLTAIAMLWNKTGMAIHLVLLFILIWIFLSEAGKQSLD